MINTIEIDNFQSHKGTVIELSEGVNVIKGRSHSGKSSIMRAARWVLLNQPRGVHFVSHFSDSKESTFVGMEFSEGTYAIRQREGTVPNGYESSSGDFQAMRSDVPDEIQQITRMNSINIQTQGDPYFMLNQTAGKVAKEINKLVGLDIIDIKLGKLNRIENEAGAKLNLLEERRDSEKEELGNLSFVSDLEARVTWIEMLWEKYNAILVKKGVLTDMLENLQTLKEDVETTTKWLTIEKPYTEIMRLVERRSFLAVSLNELKKLYADLIEAKKVWHHADSQMDHASERQEQIENSTEYRSQFCRYCGSHQSHWRKE